MSYWFHGIAHLKFLISFVLNNVLYVPHISRNVLSLSRLCQDNNISIIFFSLSFHVKDLSTNNLLLQGQTHHGVYDCSFSPYVHILEKISPSTWHHNLGHPSNKTQQILSIFISSSAKFSCNSQPCNSCQVNKSHKLSFHDSTLVSAPLERTYIFFYVWTSLIPSYDNLKYYINFVYYFTKYCIQLNINLIH